MIIDIQELLDKGYHEFHPTMFNDGAEKAYQKRFRDENGTTLYFINAYMYVHYIIKEIQWEVEVQLYQQGTHEPLNLKFFCGWTLQDVEDYVQRVYNVGFEPYEH